MSILKIVTWIITLSSRQRENKTPLSFFLWDNKKDTDLKHTRYWFRQKKPWVDLEARKLEGFLQTKCGSLKKLEDATSAGIFIDSAPRDCAGNLPAAKSPNTPRGGGSSCSK